MDAFFWFVTWIGGPSVIIGLIYGTWKISKAISASTKPLHELSWTYLFPRDPETQLYEMEVPLKIIHCYRSELIYKNGRYIHYVLIEHDTSGYKHGYIDGRFYDNLGYTRNKYRYALLKYIGRVCDDESKRPVEHDKQDQQEIEDRKSVV